jgi:ATP-dependent protease HslVU (ClpYQ) ATPase subunit
MDPKLKASYILFIAGGVAGNKFAGLATDYQGAGPDREELARLTDESLEKVAEMAVAIIHKHRRHFRQLVSLIRLRYTERILKNRDVQTGRVSLLSQEDIQGILEASK